MEITEQQLQQLIQQVAQEIQRGADPNQILQQLIQGNVPEPVARQIIQAATQGGNSVNGMFSQKEVQGLVEKIIGQIGPEAMLAFLNAYEQMDDANKQGLLQMLQQLTSQQTPSQSGVNPQNEQASAAQENLFGRA